MAASEIAILVLSTLSFVSVVFVIFDRSSSFKMANTREDSGSQC